MSVHDLHLVLSAHSGDLETGPFLVCSSQSALARQAEAGLRLLSVLPLGNELEGLEEYSHEGASE